MIFEGIKNIFGGEEKESAPEKPQEGQEKVRIGHHAGGGDPLQESWTEARQIGQEREKYEKEMEEKIEKAKTEKNAELHQRLVQELKEKREEFHKQEKEIAERVAKNKKYTLDNSQ